MRNAQRRRLSLEVLEDRRVPASLSLSWPDPAHLNLSHVPDGAPAGSAPIVINYNLNAATNTINATIFNTAGQAVFSLNATKGQTTSTSNFTLPTGQCYLDLVATNSDGSSPDGLLYNIGISGIGSDPIDPFDPPSDPLGNGPNNPYGFIYNYPGAIPTYSTLNPVYTNPWL